MHCYHSTHSKSSIPLVTTRIFLNLTLQKRSVHNIDCSESIVCFHKLYHFFRVFIISILLSTVSWKNALISVMVCVSAQSVHEMSLTHYTCRTSSFVYVCLCVIMFSQQNVFIKCLCLVHPENVLFPVSVHGTCSQNVPHNISICAWPPHTSPPGCVLLWACDYVDTGFISHTPTRSNRSR